MRAPFLSRLDFHDKISFDRAYSYFRHKQDTTSISEEEERFLLSLLDSGTSFEDTSVANTINITRSWAELGQIPTQNILARILELCFMRDKFVQPFICLADMVPSHHWIFKGLSKLVMDKSSFDLVSQSIVNDAPIWDFLIFHLRSDVRSRPIDYTLRYCDRDDNCSFLIESLILFWPSEQARFLSISSLVETFCGAMMAIDSKTARDLIDVACWVFPADVAKLGIAITEALLPESVCLLLSLEMLQIPDISNGAPLALKAMVFNRDLALALAQADTETEGREDIVEIITRYNPETQQISFE
jgi:hypothetical protein